MLGDDYENEMNKSTTPKALIVLAALFGAGHVANLLGSIKISDQITVLETSLAEGAVKADLVVNGSAPISLTSSSKTDLELFERLAAEGKKDRGSVNFPKYDKSTYSIRTKDGKACDIILESRLLLNLVDSAKKHPAEMMKVASIADLAKICKKSEDELRKQIKVTFNDKQFQQEFGAYTTAATPHQIVSNGQTVSTVIPQASRMV